jgi:hypothetical protein
MRYGILFGLLLICTIMSGVTEDNQKSVFAQITPAPEKFGSNDDVATDISHDTDAGYDNPQGITPSEKTDDTAEEVSPDSTDSNYVNGGQTTTEQDDETITSEEDLDPADQLVEAIMNEVNEALSASSIFSP